MTNEQSRDVAISTSVRLARNYQDLPFPCRMDAGDEQLVIERAGDALSGLPNHFEFERLSGMSESRKAMLCDRQLMEKGTLKFPDRAAILMSQECGMGITLCSEEHLLIQAVRPGLSLSEAYDADEAIDRLLDQRGAYAFDEQFGYLTSRPTRCGTGLTVFVTLHLPGLMLAKKVRPAVREMAEAGMSLQPGSGGDHDSFGQYYRLANRCSLGRSEEEILSASENAAIALINRERNVREELMQQDALLLQDRIYRSAAILQNARIMSVLEMFIRLSDLRLGICLGLFNLPLETLDQWCTNLRPSVMRSTLGENATDRMLDEERARVLRELTASIP